MSNFIPNSFQTPNAYVDAFMAFLTEAEWKILSYTTRRILGFNKLQDQISLSQYEDGLVLRDKRTGEIVKRYDWGTGLSRSAIRPALANLIKFGLVIEVSPEIPEEGIGATYALQLDSEKVNRVALRERFEQRRQRDQARTSKARASAAAKRQASQSVGQTGADDSGLNEAGAPTQSVRQTRDTPSVGQPPPQSVGQPPPQSVGQTNNNQDEIQFENQDSFAPAPAGEARLATGKGGRKKQRTADEQAQAERHKEILDGYLTGLNYAHDGAREARAASKLAKLGYTSDRVQKYYRAQKATPYWFEKHLSLEAIARDIGAWEQSRASNKNGGPNGTAKQAAGATFTGSPGAGPLSRVRSGLAGVAVSDDAIEQGRRDRERRAATRGNGQEESARALAHGEQRPP